MNELIGKVVRLHSNIEPNKIRLYLITNDEHDAYSQGKVRFKTVNEWIERGLKLTFYSQLDG